uniref:Oxidoreductase n=1 Tax=uncultured Elusimicrobia bacterium TaxID=699876 RepID=A0A650EME2_9BACT|nr:oxidoreductase [uncultured Elusimicrobia bacterium]
MFDAVIIGLGPAGSTLARLLAGKYNILCLDKKVSSGGFEKPCGGLLAPDAQKILARFDLTLPKSVLVDPQLFAVRTLDLPSGLTRHYQRFYVNMDRAKFDRWLISLIPSSVPVYSGAKVIRISRDEDGAFTVCFERDGKAGAVRTRRVIGADGAASVVRRAFFPKHKIRSYMAVQQWFKETHKSPFYSCVFDAKETDCYSWSVSKDGYFIFGGAYPVKDCRARFERQKNALAKLGFQFGDPVKTEACLVLRPAGWKEFCLGENGVFLIGEAAGLISSSSLEGVSSAFKSALALAASLGAQPGVDEHRRYAHKTFILRLKLFLKLFKCPFMYWPPLRRWVMKSGLSSIKIISSK